MEKALQFELFPMEGKVKINTIYNSFSTVFTKFDQ